MAYAFNAGGFKLGDRVEIINRKVKGVLMAEIIHMTQCNTYQVLCPDLKNDKGQPKILNVDHMLLRKLEATEPLLDKTTELTEENSFCPKGTDINGEWIQAAIEALKEPISEIDEAIGVEEMTIKPGMQVWHKLYMMPMLVQWVTRYAYGKALEYGCVAYQGTTEIVSNDVAYALVPMEQMVDIYPDDQGKTGCDEGFQLSQGFTSSSRNAFEN